MARWSFLSAGWLTRQEDNNKNTSQNPHFLTLFLQVLEKLPEVPRSWPLVGQFSSIGSLGTEPTKWLTTEWSSSLAGRGARGIRLVSQLSSASSRPTNKPPTQRGFSFNFYLTHIMKVLRIGTFRGPSYRFSTHCPRQITSLEREPVVAELFGQLKVQGSNPDPAKWLWHFTSSFCLSAPHKTCFCYHQRDISWIMFKFNLVKMLLCIVPLKVHFVSFYAKFLGFFCMSFQHTSCPLDRCTV